MKILLFDTIFTSCYNLFIMNNEILEKFNNQDKEFVKINKTLDKHSKNFDKVNKTLDKHSKKFDKRFNEMDGRFDFLATKYLDHEERLKNIEENMATKSDIRKIMDVLDVLVGMFKKHDQEFIFMKTRFERNEEKIEKNTVDIKEMKPILGLS